MARTTGLWRENSGGMSENRAGAGGPFISRPLARVTSRPALTRLRNDWRALERLIRQARGRLRSAHGIRNKLKETAWIAGKARERFAKRLKGVLSIPPAAHPSQGREDAVVAQTAALTTRLASSRSLPSCQRAGHGAIVVNLAEGATLPETFLRDRHGNLYEASGRLWQDPPTFAREGAGAVRLLIQIPPDLLESESRIDVLLRTESEQVVFDNIPLDGKSHLRVQAFRFENNVVSFAGECTLGHESDISLAVSVDGDLSASCEIAPKGGIFAGSMILDRSHLDGRAHLVELRDLHGLTTLASLYQVLPLHITPWNALQVHARPPLDRSLAPEARHILRSYQHWFEHLRRSGPDHVPPLDLLERELSQGFKKRHAYPRIAFARPAEPLVSIVIPVHNRCEVTYLCLCSLLFAFNETSFEVIIVDDGSTDETRHLDDFVDGIEIVRHEAARGFVRSCNHGAGRARGEFVVLLNNDTLVTARWLDELVAAFRNFDRVGVAGSKLVYPDGRLQEAGGVIWGSGNPWNVGRDGNPEDPRYNYLRKVDYVSGAALMIPRALWQNVGGFSEEFAPAYFEDTDLAMKVRETGHFVVYVPTSTVYHFEGQSAGTSIASGMKSFQEVNRPKFRKKWAHAYREHGREGEGLDREKDRAAAIRVLFIDHQFPFVDNDAGSYAAFQEVRMLQALGAKVTFMPRNLAWMDRHTAALQRIGVECLYAPYVMNFFQYISECSAEYDLVFVTRYKIAEQVIPLVRAASPRTKIAFNLADLHYLREFREAAAKTPGYSRGHAEATRLTELATVETSDITFSYSDVELDILRREARPGTTLAKMPWIVDCSGRTTRFSSTRDILFLGGFGHPPNIQAVKYFANQVMPLMRQRLPGVAFNVIGSGARAKVPELKSDDVRILGYVPNVGEHLDRTRVFVAPLLAGAGLKGKVLDAISHGLACVLSPVAAEGTGLVDGVNCLIADSPAAWADCVTKLYTDEVLWNEIGTNALKLARTEYSFSRGVDVIEQALTQIAVTGRREWGLPYRYARPDRYGI